MDAYPYPYLALVAAGADAIALLHAHYYAALIATGQQREDAYDIAAGIILARYNDELTGAELDIDCAETLALLKRVHDARRAMAWPPECLCIIGSRRLRIMRTAAHYAHIVDPIAPCADAVKSSENPVPCVAAPESAENA